jgi:hypothetical protein
VPLQLRGQGQGGLAKGERRRAPTPSRYVAFEAEIVIVRVFVAAPEFWNFMVYF